MKTLNIVAKITVCCYDELNELQKKLIESAKKVSEFAYAPYSQFSVGAAVLLDNGEIVTGNNQENIAYPSGMCAERVAVYCANAHYPDAKIRMIAIAASQDKTFVSSVSPCGSCRQVLIEAENRFQSPISLLLYGKEEICIVNSIKDLLPLSFSF